MNPAGRIRSLWSGARAFFAGSHKTTVVICPAAALPAKVELDPVDAMESCSRWPELDGCGQECMPQVKYSAEPVEDFTARYEGNKCTSCGVTLTRDDWYKSRLAALDSQAAARDIAGSRPRSSREDGDPICSTCFGEEMPTH